ncbi:hypothetical protein F4778DRAFT_800717 [Xylariomycetidae sp. FL2044]|nr:hypothetical protein F4778DRAFT_800717 [Xylariomycetidae sp. FL2044]
MTSIDCQRQDWPSHKTPCKAKALELKGGKWYDAHRRCEDGSRHFGELELITWGGTVHHFFTESTGWGNCSEDESADLKRKYEDEFKSNDAQMYEYWPQGYRWTCCGMGGDQPWGCDHHGTGPQPCQCDFCHLGKPLPDKIYHEDSVARKGLQLARGPDPRSLNPSKAATAEIARGILGM